MKLFILAALAALTISGQQSPVAAKPVDSPKLPSAASPAAAPTLPSTARLWRLVSQVQALRQQLGETELGKALKAAEQSLEQEQQKLASTCGPGFILGYQQDPKAENAGDVVCQSKPPDPVVAKKEK